MMKRILDISDGNGFPIFHFAAVAIVFPGTFVDGRGKLQKQKTTERPTGLCVLCHPRKSR